MKAYDQRYMNLSIRSMEEQLLTKMIFPVPGLKSINGHNSESVDVIDGIECVPFAVVSNYHTPSRYHPSVLHETSSVFPETNDSFFCHQQLGLCDGLHDGR